MIINSKYLALLLALTATAASQAQQADDDLDGGPLDQVVPVAAEGTDNDAVVAVPNASRAAEQRLYNEFERYKTLISEGTMDEADTSAKRIVEMAIEIYGPVSIETSKALNNLALVQNKNNQYEPAIQNFESSIEIIEALEDRLNERLVNPLKGLGSAQLSNGRPDLALRSFGRATHITHVNEGPHNIEQVEILESVAEANLRMGDAKTARKMLDRIHVLNVRHFDNNELALLPSLMRRANWQHRAGYYNDERATYRRAIRIVEGKLGKNHPQLILPLSKLGQSFYFVDLNPSNTQYQGTIMAGEIYFKRAARIAAASPGIGWQQIADTKLALADHYMFVDSYNRARRIYGDVWAELSVDDERLAARAKLLEQPRALITETLPKYAGKGVNAGGKNDEFLTGTIRVDYNVSERGRVRKIRTEANPEEFTDMQRIVHREIRRHVFRPKMVDGQIQESEDLVFEHTFYYRQTELDKLKNSANETAPQSVEDNSQT